MKNKKLFSKIMLWFINIIIAICGWTLLSFLITLSCTICNIFGFFLIGFFVSFITIGINKLINTNKK